HKEALRLIDGAIAVEEAVGIPSLPDDLGEGRRLSVDLVVDGEVDESFVGTAGVKKACARHDESMAALPRSARRLQDGGPAIPTVFYSDCSSSAQAEARCPHRILTERFRPRYHDGARA